MTNLKKTVLSTIFIIIFICIISGFLLFHPFFKIAHIQIKNNNFIPKTKLQAISNSYLKKNIFKIWLNRTIQKQIMSNFPQIKSIHLSIFMPDKLQVIVKEKKPIISFLSEKKTILVAKDGTILNKGSAEYTIPNLDKIVIIEGIPFSLFGENTICPPLLLKSLAITSSLKSFLPESSFQVKFQKLNLNEINDPLDKIILYKNDTLPIKIGNLINLDNKMKTLNSFLTNFIIPKNKAISYLDLRVNNRVIVKYETI